MLFICALSLARAVRRRKSDRGPRQPLWAPKAARPKYLTPSAGAGGDADAAHAAALTKQQQGGKEQREAASVAVHEVSDFMRQKGKEVAALRSALQHPPLTGAL